MTEHNYIYTLAPFKCWWNALPVITYLAVSKLLKQNPGLREGKVQNNDYFLNISEELIIASEYNSKVQLKNKTKACLVLKVIYFMGKHVYKITVRFPFSFMESFLIIPGLWLEKLGFHISPVTLLKYKQYFGLANTY